VGGKIPYTSPTGIPVGTRAWSWSTTASTRRILHTSRTVWPRKMQPCGPLWCAGTFLSMEACWPATASSRGYPWTRQPATNHPGGGAATTLLPITDMDTTAAVDLVTTRAVAPPPPWTEGNIRKGAARSRKLERGGQPRAFLDPRTDTCPIISLVSLTPLSGTEPNWWKPDRKAPLITYTMDRISDIYLRKASQQTSRERPGRYTLLVPSNPIQFQERGKWRKGGETKTFDDIGVKCIQRHDFDDLHDLDTF